ncbi:MAG: helix-turn-helix domain-containing protein [Firmicutes bacterium]|nr:helix-turn-helix domain-containing protein [Bacillota bacterium]
MTKERRHEVEALWRDRVADLRASGMTVARLAEAHQLPAERAYYWLRRFRQEEEGSSPLRGRLIPVTVEEEPKAERSAPVLTVRVGVFSVDVRAGCDRDMLRRVAKTLMSL